MARRFPSGVAGLLQGLMWIQREPASGSLETAGAGESGSSCEGNKLPLLSVVD